MEEIVSMATSLIVKLIVAGVTALITYYVIPYLKDKGLYDMVSRYVKAAEKLAESAQITKEEKKQYVIDLLISKKVKITPAVEAMIEAAVTELDLAKQSFKSGITE